MQIYTNISIIPLMDFILRDRRKLLNSLAQVAGSITECDFTISR
jgi:hypothetical protein